MTRTVRLVLLIFGLGIVAILVYRAGLRLVMAMFVRVGWGIPAVAAIYAVHVGVRAAALWRSALGGGVCFVDVLRIRLAGEAVEMLTFTGPFLAEPGKGWLLKQRGLTTADAFAAVATEYLLYTVVSSCLTAIALSLLLARGALPPAVRPGAIVVLVIAFAFLGAVFFAAATGVGVIVPILRASRVFVGARRAERAAREMGGVEDGMVRLLHAHHGRLAEVLAIEMAAHLLLILEMLVVFGALGFSRSWSSLLIFEGGVKLIGSVFAFVPGQFGASEAVYEVLAGAVGMPAAAGLTLALVRRMRSLLAAAAGVVALAAGGSPVRGKHTVSEFHE